MKRIYVLFCCILIVVSGSLVSAWAEGTDEGYRIGCGDILRIETWKEPDFTREEVPVRPDGKISFPMLDDVQAAGLTPLELKNGFQKRIRKYVSDAAVTVSVKEARSQKFYVVGEVEETGEYELLKPLTVLQAFALAGGFTEWAEKDEIILLRVENGKNRIHRINYKEIVKGKNLEQNLRLKADDTIIVP